MKDSFALDLLPVLTSGLPSLEFERRLLGWLHVILRCLQEGSNSDSKGTIISCDIFLIIGSAAFTTPSNHFPLIATACWSPPAACLH